MSAVRRRLPFVGWLTVVWVLLWGTVTVPTVLGGLVVAALVVVAFPLPERPALPVRPWRLLRLLGFVAADLAVSAVLVSWETLRYGPAARAGVVAVPLLTGSDRVVALVAGAIALSPGSFVLQLDRPRGVWYVYALGLRGPGDTGRIRREVLTLQRRVVAALGTADEQAALDHIEGPVPR